MTRGRVRAAVDWRAIADVPLPQLRPASADDLRPGDYPEGLLFDALTLGDLAADGTSVVDCRFRRCVVDDGRWRRARLSSCVLDDWRITALDVSDSSWTDVVVRHSRIGALVAHGLNLLRVTVESSRIDYLNLRGATLDQVQYVDCRVGELDLAMVAARSVRFSNCEINKLRLSGATLDDVDLRGAELDVIEGIGGLAGAGISDAQLVRLAPALAGHLGIRVLPSEFPASGGGGR